MNYQYDLEEVIPLGCNKKGAMRYLLVLISWGPELTTTDSARIRAMDLIPPCPCTGPLPEQIHPYPQFPDSLHSDLVEFARLGLFPPSMCPMRIDHHPLVKREDDDPVKLIVYIELARRELDTQFKWDDVSHILSVDQIAALKQFFNSRRLAITEKLKSCTCDNYVPGMACGYKGTQEPVCLNCAPLCQYCWAPTSCLYNEDTEEAGCYNCLS